MRPLSIRGDAAKGRQRLHDSKGERMAPYARLQTTRILKV